MALDFRAQGTDARIDLPTSFLDTGTGAFAGSFAAWVRLNASSIGHYIFGKGANTTRRHQWVLGGAACVLIRDRGGADLNLNASPANFAVHADAKWLFIAATWDSASATNCRFFMGDVDTPPAEPSAYTTQTNGSGSIPSNAGDVARIGGDSRTTTEAFDGRIAWAAFWDTVLTAADFERLWLRPRWYQSPTGLYVLDRDGTVRDFSGNGNDGTITTATLIDGPPVTLWRRRASVVVPVSVAASGAMSATVTASASVSATLTGAGALIATVTAAGSTTAALTGAGALAATAAGAGSLSATLTGAGALAGTVTASGSVSATLAGAGALASTVAGAGAVSATLAGAGALAATIAGLGSVTAALTDAGSNLIATVAGTSSVSATLTGAGALAATAAGQGSVSAVLGGAGALTASLSGTATVTGALAGTGNLIASVGGTATVTGTLAGAGALVALVAGTGSVTATIRDAAAIEMVLMLVDASVPVYHLTDTSLAALAAEDTSLPFLSLTDRSGL